jgi:hypothetical protein
MGDLMRFEKIELWIHCLIVHEGTTLPTMRLWMGSVHAAETSHVRELIAFCVRERLAGEGSTVAAIGEIESHVNEQAAFGAEHVSLVSARLRLCRRAKACLPGLFLTHLWRCGFSTSSAA